MGVFVSNSASVLSGVPPGVLPGVSPGVLPGVPVGVLPIVSPVLVRPPFFQRVVSEPECCSRHGPCCLYSLCKGISALLFCLLGLCSCEVLSALHFRVIIGGHVRF